MSDEKRLTAEDKYDYTVSHDQMQIINQIIRENPIPTEDEVSELMKRYRAGDMSARDRLVNGNMRLIVSEAKKFAPVAKSSELVDLIDEGVIGFIKGLEKYDETRAKLSTYMIPWIYQRISRSLAQTDDMIRLPDGLQRAAFKYARMYVSMTRDGKPIPSDEEWCDILGVSMTSFEYIKKKDLYTPLSMNKRIDDNEDSEFESYIGTDEKGYDESIDDITNKELLIYLKERYNPTYYHILYHRVLSPDKKSLEEEGSVFGVNRERVRQIQEQMLAQLKQLYEVDSLVLKKGIARIRDTYDVEHYDVSPMDVEHIFVYLFLRNSFTEDERRVYKFMFTKKYIYSTGKMAQILGLSVEEFLEIKNSIQAKISRELKLFKEEYKIFKEQLLKGYKGRITKIDLDIPDSELPVNYRHIATTFENYTYDEFMQTYDGPPINPRIDDLLKKYFGLKGHTCTLKEAEREANAIIFNFAKKDNLLLNAYFKTLQENRDSFSEVQYDYLMAYRFNRMARGEFYQKHPGAKIVGSGSLWFKSLEKKHFNISDYRVYNFTRDKYLEVRDKCISRLSADKIHILDMIYGVNTELCSIGDIAGIFNITYNEAHGLVRSVRESAIGIYIKKKSSLDIDYNIYLPFLYDERIDIEKRDRDIVIMYVVEKADYETISERFGINNKKVSNIITETMRRIDFYRFGIVSLDDKYTQEEIEFALSCMVDEELLIVQEVLSKKSHKEIASKFNIDINRVRRIMSRFYQFCRQKRTENIEITTDKIFEEVQLHISESVLNEKQKMVLSYLYGINYSGNPDGVKMSVKSLSEKLGVDIPRIQRLKKSAINTIKERAAGFIRPTLGYMGREDVAVILEDLRVPISKKEREFLYHSFELNGYPYLNLQELSEKYGESMGNVKRRIQRAFVSIYKYMNGEESAAISYDLDIIPKLRFFCKIDQKIITSLYDEELSYRELAEKYNMTFEQIGALVERCRVYLHDLINEKANGFDFDFFYDSVDFEDIPFYGDKSLAKKIFIMYYEERRSTESIISELGLNCGKTRILTIIEDLKIAVLKYRAGVKKEREFTYEEIREYYLKHFEEMSSRHKIFYFRYFERMKKEKQFHYTGSLVPPAITLDLIRERSDSWFDLSRVSKNDVLKFLRAQGRNLSRPAINALLIHFNISSRELMSGYEMMKVLKFLSQANQNVKRLAFEQQ